MDELRDIFNKPEIGTRRHNGHGEDDLQRNCVTWFDFKYPQYKMYLHHSPNGGERKYVKIHGKNVCMEGRKFKEMGVRAGFPDLIFLKPTKKHPYLGIELKYGKNTQQDTQKEYENLFKSAEAAYYVVRSLDQFIEIINKYLNELL